MSRNTKKMVDRAATHWRLAAALGGGIIGWTLAKYFDAPQGSHLLLGWIAAVLVYLLTTWALFLKAEKHSIDYFHQRHLYHWQDLAVFSPCLPGY